MLCSNCSKLSFLHTNKSCSKCQGNVKNNISILCETCSSNGHQCSVCLKKIMNKMSGGRRGCNCGK